MWSFWKAAVADSDSVFLPTRLLSVHVGRNDISFSIFTWRASCYALQHSHMFEIITKLTLITISQFFTFETYTHILITQKGHPLRRNTCHTMYSSTSSVFEFHIWKIVYVSVCTWLYIVVNSLTHPQPQLLFILLHPPTKHARVEFITNQTVIFSNTVFVTTRRKNYKISNKKIE